MSKKPVLGAASLAAILSLGACATSPQSKSLYDRLGGKDAITAVVDDSTASGRA
jgi:hypothetical protein